MVQLEVFASSETDLLTNKAVDKKSKLVSLNVFIDVKGIIRVGGKLRHANIKYSRRHPIVLPAKHPLTELLIRETHLKYLHVGPQGILALRLSYWILSGRQAITRIFRKCTML